VLAARTQARGGADLNLGADLRWRRLPEVAITEVAGGRLVAGGPAGAAALLPRLLDRLAADPAAALLSEPERRRLGWFAGAARAAAGARSRGR
jgi:hypothetical protein